MANFKGYLIRFPKSGKLFPHKLIAKDNYNGTPLQRTEIKDTVTATIFCTAQLRRITSRKLSSQPLMNSPLHKCSRLEVL